MSKMIIIDGNSNDKDQARAYMVKGEPGDPGVSPIVTVSKNNGVATISITDAEGIHVVTVNDGEVSQADLEAVLTNYKLKGDFAELTVEMPGTDTTTIVGEVAYPTGFTRENCMVIGWKMKVSTDNNYMTGTTFDSGNVYGSMPVTIQMTNDGLLIRVKNIVLSDGSYPIVSEFPNTLTWTIKVLLMKVS